ncbi:membrane protein YczE [Candidatus Puniceispirillum marinum]|uniref:Membrane protein n=1 Tax=Puniceispirillum marinum (strain IMCC1322) TaxID=488538 RepID=D5BP93_PUNMI|nr:membrane protein [Candidatus Puniceispirillum marinum]ADE38375.1 membrane protein [Candidatus Puniceispirillum marinum IMCC1322]
MAGKFAFLSIKTIPTLFWSAPKPLTMRPPLRSFVILCFGLALFGLGEALLIASAAGVSPWTVFAEGVTNVTGWSIGLATFIISVCVLLTWIPLRQIPGIGTIANAIIIALMLDFSLPYLPKPDGFMLQSLQALIGVLVTGLGGGIYLIANLGPGPRDGLMTGLQQLTNLPIAWVRSGIEISVVIIGWYLGGTVGLGTILFAFLIGPSVAASLYGLQALFGKKPVSQR